MMKTRKENFDDFRQYCLGNYACGLLVGGSGDGGGTSGGSGGGGSETEEPPPIWIDDNKNSQTSQRKTS
ncbi:MAG: hypothetical protein WBB45_16145 [Cyclobacteriaceae bacterium]